MFDIVNTIKTHVKPVIEEYFDITIPTNIRDKTIEINLKSVKDILYPLAKKIEGINTKIEFKIPANKWEIQYNTNENFFLAISELLSS